MMVDVGRLSSLSSARVYRAKEFVFHQGDPGTEMFIILSGKAQVMIMSGERSPIPLTNLRPGDFFGEMSLLEGEPRSASVQMLEDGLVLTINRANFEQIIASDPSLALKIMKGLSKRIRRLNAMITKP